MCVSKKVGVASNNIGLRVLVPSSEFLVYPDITEDIYKAFRSSNVNASDYTTWHNNSILLQLDDGSSTYMCNLPPEFVDLRNVGHKSLTFSYIDSYTMDCSVIGSGTIPIYSNYINKTPYSEIAIQGGVQKEVNSTVYLDDKPLMLINTDIAAISGYDELKVYTTEGSFFINSSVGGYKILAAGDSGYYDSCTITGFAYFDGTDWVDISSDYTLSTYTLTRQTDYTTYQTVTAVHN